MGNMSDSDMESSDSDIEILLGGHAHSDDSDGNARNVRQRTNSNVDVGGRRATVRRNPNANRGGPANADDNNTGRARPRTQLGGFVATNGTELRSPGHATGLTGILQLGSAHQDGIIGAFGHNNKTRWFLDNIDAIFADDGPLRAYLRINARTLMRHFSEAQQLARSIYTQDHSNEPTGRGHEDIPQWTALFFRLFEAMQNQETSNSRAAAAREENRPIVRGIIGAQAPLGEEGDGPVQLRTETSPNVGQRGMRQREIGNVNAERVTHMEGRDDAVRRNPVPSQRHTTGTHHRNVHVAPGFDPDTNAPSERYGQVMLGFGSMNAAIDTFSRFMDAPLPLPARELIDIARDYREINQMLGNATTDNERQFFISVRDALVTEMNQFGGTVGGSRNERAGTNGGTTNPTANNEDAAAGIGGESS